MWQHWFPWWCLTARPTLLICYHPQPPGVYSLLWSWHILFSSLLFRPFTSVHIPLAVMCHLAPILLSHWQFLFGIWSVQSVLLCIETWGGVLVHDLSKYLSFYSGCQILLSWVFFQVAFVAWKYRDCEKIEVLIWKTRSFHERSH